MSEQYLKIAADRERAGRGLPPLRSDTALSAAARQHAVLMANRNSISHQYPGEPDLASRAAAAGARFSLVTENVAQAPSAVIVHTAWMHSEGHKHNLLDPKVDAVGIAVISRDGQMFAVEDFARSVAALSIAEQEDVVAERVRAFGLIVLAAGEEARRVCAGSSLHEMKRAPEFIMRYTTEDLERLPHDLVLKLDSRRYTRAIAAACKNDRQEDFTMYRAAVLLYGP